MKFLKKRYSAAISDIENGLGRREGLTAPMVASFGVINMALASLGGARGTVAAKNALGRLWNAFREGKYAERRYGDVARIHKFLRAQPQCVTEVA